MTIEKGAINYQPGAADKCCLRCYQSEQKLAAGLWCLMFDCKTRPDGWCGVGVVTEKRDIELPGQIDLFS